MMMRRMPLSIQAVLLSNNNNQHGTHSKASATITPSGTSSSKDDDDHDEESTEHSPNKAITIANSHLSQWKIPKRTKEIDNSKRGI
jgi:hypothetical protein